MDLTGKMRSSVNDTYLAIHLREDTGINEESMG